MFDAAAVPADHTPYFPAGVASRSTPAPVRSFSPSEPLRPFVKWVGGKRQLLDLLNGTVPSHNRYIEPFIGGGALLFSRQPNSATISDINPELINCYQIIRDNVEGLVRSLRCHKNTEDHFYMVRAKKTDTMTPVQRASRFIYLNKTCFNGLYRENKSGQFNTPFGRYTNPCIVDEDNLHAISRYLRRANVEILHSGYQHVLTTAQVGDLVYFDPPYAPLTKTANFAAYTKAGFTQADQEALAETFATLHRRGVKLMLSNSNADLIRDLYKDFSIETVYATRAISCKGAGRAKAANEVLVTNFR